MNYKDLSTGIPFACGSGS